MKQVSAAPAGADPSAVRFIFNPVVVLRTGGLSVPTSQLPAGAAIACELGALRDVDHVSDRARLLCQQLEQLLPSAYDLDPSCGRAMLAVKRALFNRKVPSGEQMARITPALSAQQLCELDQLASMLRAPDLETIRHSAYQEELGAGIEAALKLGRDALLRRGIEVANSALFKRLALFERRPDSLSAKDRTQLALRLARYALRASRKTSPLSSLGLVTLCQIDESTPWHPAQTPLAASSQVRHATQISHSALEALLVPLLTQMSNVRPETLVCLNSSLQHGADGFTWWRVLRDEQPDSRVRRTRVESASSNGTLLHVVYRLLGKNPGGTLSIAELQARLEQLLPPDSAKKAGRLLEDLWRLDIIQPNLALVDDQFALAQRRAAALIPELSTAIASALARLANLLVEPDDGKPIPVEHMEAAFGHLVELTGSSTTLAQFRPIIIENCTSPEPEPRIGAGLVRDLQPVLSLLLRLSPLLAADSPMSRLRQFAVDLFQTSYGSGQSVADCLPFIRSCSAELQKFLASSPQERQEKLDAIRDPDERQARLAKLRDSLLDTIAAAASRGERTTLHAADLEHFARQSTALASTNIISHMFFVQPYVDEGAACYVLNQIYPGAASTYTRFLETRPDLVAPTADYLDRISEPGPCWELAESFCFNASAYPTLTGRRVSVPPHHVDNDTVVSISNLGMRHRPTFGDLVFTDPNGEDVSIFCPIVMSPFAMAKAQQIVRALGSWVEMIDDVWQVAASRVKPDSHGVRRLGRVEIDNLVVIRKCVICPHDVLPSATLPAAEFFFSLYHWARANALPTELFARRFKPEGSSQSQMWGKPPGKSGKPMPLQLDCPISVLAFQKALAQSSDHIVFTEALPGPGHHVASRDGDPIVCEMGIELSMVIEKGEHPLNG